VSTKSLQPHSLLNGIKNWQGATIDEDENSDFYDVYNIIYDVVNNGNSLHDISQQQLDKIELMAVSPYATSAAAQAILAKVQGRRYFDIPDSKPISQPRMASLEDMASNENRVIVYPNPTTGTINIVSHDPMAYCIVHDVKGGSTSFNVGNPYTATIQLDMPSGLYVLELVFKDGISETSKIILQR